MPEKVETGRSEPSVLARPLPGGPEQRGRGGHPPIVQCIVNALFGRSTHQARSLLCACHGTSCRARVHESGRWGRALGALGHVVRLGSDQQRSSTRVDTARSRDHALGQPHGTRDVQQFGKGCHQVDVLGLPWLHMMGICLRPRVARGIQQSSRRAMPRQPPLVCSRQRTLWSISPMRITRRCRSPCRGLLLRVVGRSMLLARECGKWADNARPVPGH